MKLTLFINICAAAFFAANACTSPCTHDRTKCCPQSAQKVCEGDTRGDRKCNHDMTHRVCAKIGNKDTSFFKFTGQANLERHLPGWKGLGWCGTKGDYYGPKGSHVRCPEDNPTWCICKWATAVATTPLRSTALPPTCVPRAWVCFSATTTAG